MANKSDKSAEARGVLLGMVEAHGIFYNALRDVQLGIETMQCIYDAGNTLGQHTKTIKDLELILNTLTYLEEKFQGDYDGRIDSYKEEYGDEFQ